MFPPMKNLDVFLAFLYVASSGTRDVLGGFISANSTYSDAFFILVHLCSVNCSELHTSWAHSVSTVLPYFSSTSFRRIEGQLPRFFWQAYCLYYTQLIHPYHREALTPPGPRLFPINLGQIFLFFFCTLS